MKKLIYPIVIIFLFSSYSYSQDSHLGLSMGVALPYGDFSKTENVLENGFAQTGFNLSFDVNYIPTWYFGIAGTLNFSTNYPDAESLREKTIDELTTNHSLTFPNDATIAYVTNNWSYVNFFIGPSVAIPINFIQINIRALSGLSVILPPEDLLKVEYGTTKIESFSDDQNIGLGFLAGIDLIYNLNTSSSIVLGTEYYRSKTSYSLEVIDTSTDDKTTLTTIDKEHAIEAFNIKIGLAYSF